MPKSIFDLRTEVPATSPCRLLYHQRNLTKEFHAVAEHRHAFWQWEILFEGRIWYECGEKKGMLEHRRSLLIPPGMKHAFKYERSHSDWLSIKFETDREFDCPAGILIEHDIQHAGLHDLLKHLLPPLCPDPERSIRIVVSHLLSALFNLLFPDDEDLSFVSDTVTRKVMRHIRRSGGQHIKISEMAHSIGYTPGALSSRFRQQTGMALKEYIDLQRSQHAARMLTYSDQSIQSIADALDFPDPYTFSRFFKRMNGSSPRTFRKRLTQQRNSSDKTKKAATKDASTPDIGVLYP